MIVADTSLISYLHFKTQYSEEANSVHMVDPVWACPILWRSEFLNVVNHHLRNNLISFEDGIRTVELAKKVIGECEFTVSPVDVLTLSTNTSCTTYDCEFVALAQDLGVKLVTYDKQVLSTFPGIAISANEFIKIYRR